ncbi:MAG: 2-amino-4-hydroxy-6-hydroxymethyldihydropteridine diphosphokinase [Clostridiales bacterium]|nr:2-amino-4-hydroxy-6-hydroxymethyldihydropteridine diphosphokinase [Clostridiales bacterium]
MDLIKIDDLEVFANHGVYAEENEKGQYFYVSIRIFTDFKAAAEKDDLNKTVNYGEVCDFVCDFMTENTFKLIETAADGLAEEILFRFSGAREVFVEIKKPQAPVNHKFGCISVCTSRKWHRAFIALGSNLGNKAENIEYGLKLLKSEDSAKILKVSDFIDTAPYVQKEQDKFLNGAAEIQTPLEPTELLRLLKETEETCGREKTFRWGPRTLDLDIIFYDELITDSPELTIPHREMHLRDFVKIPLCQIAPDFVHPVLRKRICEL